MEWKAIRSSFSNLIFFFETESGSEEGGVVGVCFDVGNASGLRILPIYVFTKHKRTQQINTH